MAVGGRQAEQAAAERRDRFERPAAPAAAALHFGEQPATDAAPTPGRVDEDVLDVAFLCVAAIADGGVGVADQHHTVVCDDGECHRSNGVDQRERHRSGISMGTDRRRSVPSAGAGRKSNLPIKTIEPDYGESRRAWHRPRAGAGTPWQTPADHAAVLAKYSRKLSRLI